MTRPNESAWRSMDSAPRDGTLVFVGADGEWFVMRWNPIGSNSLVQPDPVGIWEASDDSFTWSEDGGWGPTGWQPYETEGATQ